MAETIEKHEGTVLVNTTDPEVLEGEWDHSRTVVVEFPSVEAARAWYTGPAYEEVKPVRIESSEYANAVIYPELSPRDRTDPPPELPGRRGVDSRQRGTTRA